MATTGEPFGLFWDSESGDRTYSTASFEYWLKKFFTSGVFNGDLQVKASSGMTLEIEPGYANVDGKVKFWNGAFTLTLNAANSTYPRIDTIVITRDNVNRQIVCEVVTGSYSGDTPQPTAPVRNSEIYQLVLAQIYVGAGVTGITQANITDTRPDNTLCGWITGTVEELDFSQFTAQFEQYFREFKADAEGDYESWFNEVQSEQIEDKEAWDAWYAALQEELHNLPADSAEYLQIQIDELKESGLSGSIFKITTINPSLEGKTVRIINADNTEEKTGTFDSNLECVIYGMKSVGEITITSTDGIETATSVVSIPYFGNYTVPIAFWAATVNMQGDTNLYGATITIKDSDNLTVGTVVLSAIDGTGTFTASKADTYTFNFTYQGTSYSQELVVSEETTYSISLSAGFSWQIWVDTASQLDSTDYESLDEVLEDEKALRELFLEHACVDYMASVGASNEDLETVINDDYCAKWINNSDYALDFLGANTVIKALMDEADKYGYGEWALMPQVPTMTSNTAPYGTIYSSSIESGFAAYYSFDGNLSTAVRFAANVTNNYITYEFTEPKNIKSFRMYGYVGVNCPVNSKPFTIQGSNDNANWTDLYSGNIEKADIIEIYDEINNDAYYSFYRVFCPEVMFGTNWAAGWFELQYYAWAPKGNVPVMTANNAPYGEAIVTSQQTNYEAYRVFDRNYATKVAINGSAISAYVGYKFTNPICVRKTYIYTDITDKDLTYQVQYSDDNSTWTDASEAIEMERGNVANIDVADSGYHLYWRIVRTVINGGAAISGICNELQFYGRELKVSVPNMTSNTAPYGVVSASDYASGGEPYKAFDADASSAWTANTSTSGSGSYVEYEFPAPVIIKQIYAHLSSNLSQTYTYVYKVLAKDGDSWVDLVADTTIVATNNNAYVYLSLSDNETPYSAYRIYKVSSTIDNKFRIWDAQLWGIDYSEKEFEAGATKKWLYDHGVELEPMPVVASGNGATYTKEDSYVLMERTAVANSLVYMEKSLDLTPYSLFRVCTDNIMVPISGTSPLHCGNMYVGESTGRGTNISIKQLSIVAGVDDKYHYSIDVTNVNETKYVGAFAFASNAIASKISISEFWLE